MASQDAPVIRRFKRGFRWSEIKLEPYKLSSAQGLEFRGASRQVLIGKLGERVNFHVRYFELEPGGFTSFERHRHAHVVIAIRGRGMVRVGEADYSIAPFDTVYIGPEKPHQLRAAGRTKFGFFCMVNARRGKTTRL
ncbi:MAG: cupin domain-containing protein [Candidatus Binataceae bacterium]|jgi:ribulose-bisphosphate carboxylase large chain